MVQLVICEVLQYLFFGRRLKEGYINISFSIIIPLLSKLSSVHFYPNSSATAAFPPFTRSNVTFSNQRLIWFNIPTRIFRDALTDIY